MKIKINWGTGIFITIFIFVSFFISFIFFSLTQNVNLVTDDYFPDEIAYESKLDKIRNTNILTEKITLKKENNKLIILFPEIINNKKISGKILLYYITDNNYDIELNIEPDKTRKQIIYTKKIKKGRYYIKIDWNLSGKKYFQEFKITI
ncbi:MAG: FixH family protein [Bacteroidales bacterium]|nr:FixH family protein [Bacteroidales bacterium]